MSQPKPKKENQKMKRLNVSLVTLGALHTNTHIEIKN